MGEGRKDRSGNEARKDPADGGDLRPKDDRIPIVRAEGFCKTYATRVLAMSTEYDIRLTLTNERVKVDGGPDFYVAEGMVILTPIAAKELHSQLGRLVREWERDHGSVEGRPGKARFTEQAL
jgi:hypothetical protein